MNQNKPIAIGIGEFLWDVLPEGKRAGGAPVNFAYHASQNGAEGWAVSAVGHDDLGKELLEVSRRHGINLLVSENDYPTGTVQVHLKDGIPSYEICENIAWDHIRLADDAIEKAKSAKAICFGSLAQRCRESRHATTTLLNAAGEDAYKVYDINLRSSFWSKEIIENSLKMSNVFKINDEELEIIKSLLGLEGLDTDEVCRELLNRYRQKMVVLTGGSAFSAIYCQDGTVSKLDTPKVEVVDTVGAGDAFCGTLVASLLCGKSIAQAHRDAIQRAAYVCTQSGAWPPISQ